MALFKKSKSKLEEMVEVKEVKQEKPAKKTGETKTGKFDHFVIKKPWITQKATMESAKNKYVFVVRENAASPEIKKAVEAIYKVSVTKINIVNAKSKIRRLGQSIGTKPGVKKAIVTIKKGESIDIIPH